MIINMVHGCGARNDHEKLKRDHGSRVAKQPIKIRNEKRTKRTILPPTDRVTLMRRAHARSLGVLLVDGKGVA